MPIVHSSEKELADKNNPPLFTKTEDPNHNTTKEPKLATPAAKFPEKNFPNGGLHAWLQVLGAFFLVFNS
ncbi:MAG: hypothetical protein Q9180_005038, partial [Flavoplaca navasiana]